MSRLFFFLLLATAGVSQSQVSDTVIINNFSEAIKLALQHNPDVLNSQLDLRIRKQQIKEAVSGGLPQVSASGKFIDNMKIPTSVLPAESFGGPAGTLVAREMGVNYNVDGGIYINQKLFDPSFLAEVKVAGAARKLSDLSLRKVKEQVILDAASTYYNAMLNRKQITYFKRQLESNVNLIKIAEAQLKAGVIKRIDLGRLQVNQINLETELEHYENIADRQINELKLITGIKGSSSVTINDSLCELPALTTQNDSFVISNRTDWRIANQQEQIQNLIIKQEKAGAFPSLSIGAQINGDLYGNEFGQLGKNSYHSSSMNLTFNVPVFDGLKRQSQLAQSRIEYEKIKNQQSQLASRVEVEIQNAKMDLAYSIKQLQSQSKNQELANDVYRQSTVEYNSGSASLSDLLNSEASLLQSQRQYLRALADKLLAEFALKKAQGTLLQTLNVNGFF